MDDHVMKQFIKEGNKKLLKEALAELFNNKEIEVQLRTISSPNRFGVSRDFIYPVVIIDGVDVFVGEEEQL